MKTQFPVGRAVWVKDEWWPKRLIGVVTNHTDDHIIIKLLLEQPFEIGVPYTKVNQVVAEAS